MAVGWLRHVAVIGCGTVGTSWAALFSAAGLSVTVYDPRIASPADLAARVDACLPALRSLGTDGNGALMLADSAAAACRSAQFVQESTPENVAAKTELIAALDADAPPDSIIASSTSSLLWSELVAGARNPGRVIVAHPFHPAHLIPLVELYGSDPAVLTRAADFYRGLRKVPVTLRREARGHIANRLSSALYREAVSLVLQGIASVEEVDTALREGPALRWSVLGVHLGTHLAAGRGGIRAYLDHLGASQEKRWEDLGTPTMDTATREALIAGVEEAYGDRVGAELEAARDVSILRRLMSSETAEH
jgi:carnitine 3-dehydrogenase